MLIFDTQRPSDSPYVERVWRSHSEGSGSFLSIAESRTEIAITRHQGRSIVTVRGAETRVTRWSYPSDAEWLGIRFKPGVSFLAHPARRLVDGALNLPEGMRGSFWLRGSTWQVPDYENADTFVERLVRDGSLVSDPSVAAALQAERTDSSLRTRQRRFLQATGITLSMVRQIERARYAVLLLKQGVSVANTTYQAGYFDQAHLTRSMRRFIGQTPNELLQGDQSEQLSFLYKTQPFVRP
jgi:AraC-like DNA-binding protein